MTSEDKKRLGILKDTRNGLISELEALYRSVPEDSVPDGHEREGYVDYPVYVKQTKARKEYLKDSIAGIEGFIAELEANA